VQPVRRAFLAAVILACASCGGAPAPEPAHAPPAHVEAPAPFFHVTYREAASVFEILDNVAGWWEGKNEPEYRAYWTKRFPLSADDERAFATYTELRRRYYEPGDGGGGLFGPRKPIDRLADAFYRSDTIAQALDRVKAFATPADVDALAAFYRAFVTRTDQLLAESKVFTSFAADLERQLASPKTTAFVQRLADAYGVKKPEPFTVLYVWWPPVENVTANNRGDVVLLKYNPKQHEDDATHSADVPVHEYVHYLSSMQPEERKRALTDVFTKGCKVPASVKPVKVLEEPMAVVHQKRFLRETDPERLDFSHAWYGGDPWISTYAKLLFNLVEQHPVVDEALVRRAARLCSQLVAVHAL
jgi:hypothetical protein